MTTTEQQRRGPLWHAPPEFPNGVDGAALLAPLYHSAWRHRGAPGRDYRRVITEHSPLLFGLTYLNRTDAPHLRAKPSGLISFSPFHLDVAQAARRWTRPRPVRDAWVLPRGAAKTTWLFLILPLWAMAHGHRRFTLFFSATEDQAAFHLQDLRAELAGNALLMSDFPELRPRRGNNTKRTVLTGGAAFAARGLGGSTLGMSTGSHRPDLIIGDDLEPDPSRHTPEAKEKIVTQVTAGILPMGTGHTVVQLAGTTTMAGSMMDDVGRAARGETVAPWIAGQGFAPRYYPAILDEGTPAERSLWPQTWSLSWLKRLAVADPQDYALNYANRPELAAVRGYWRSEHIRYDARQVITRRVLYADVAMTNRRTSDLTALVLLGLSRDGRTAVVEHAEAGRWTGLELRERMWAITAGAPDTTREWIIEANQGGERWREIVTPLPPGVRLDLEHVSGSKRSRIEVALRHYQRRAVVHAQPLPQLEQQQLAWTPQADDDDLLDALAGALRRVFPAGLRSK